MQSASSLLSLGMNTLSPCHLACAPELVLACGPAGAHVRSCWRPKWHSARPITTSHHSGMPTSCALLRLPNTGGLCRMPPTSWARGAARSRALRARSRPPLCAPCHAPGPLPLLHRRATCANCPCAASLVTGGRLLCGGMRNALLFHWPTRSFLRTAGASERPRSTHAALPCAAQHSLPLAVLHRVRQEQVNPQAPQACPMQTRDATGRQEGGASGLQRKGRCDGNIWVLRAEQARAPALWLGASGTPCGVLGLVSGCKPVRPPQWHYPPAVSHLPPRLSIGVVFLSFFLGAVHALPPSSWARGAARKRALRARSLPSLRLPCLAPARSCCCPSSPAAGTP